MDRPCLGRHLPVRVRRPLFNSLLLLIPQLLHLLLELLILLRELPGLQKLMCRGRVIAQDLLHLGIPEHLVNLSGLPLIGEIRIVLEVILPGTPALLLLPLLNLAQLTVKVHHLPISFPLNLHALRVQLIRFLGVLIDINIPIGEPLLEILFLLIDLLNLLVSLTLNLLLLRLDLLSGVLLLFSLLSAFLLGTGLPCFSQLLLNHLSDALSGIRLLLLTLGLTRCFAFRPLLASCILSASLLRLRLLPRSLAFLRLLLASGLLLIAAGRLLPAGLLLTASLLLAGLLLISLLPASLLLIALLLLNTAARSILVPLGQNGLEPRIVDRARIFLNCVNGHDALSSYPCVLKCCTGLFEMSTQLHNAVILQILIVFLARLDRLLPLSLECSTHLIVEPRRVICLQTTLK